jgi:hypothetical protein
MPYAVAAVAPKALAIAKNSRRLTSESPAAFAESTTCCGSGFPVLVKKVIVFLSVVATKRYVA